MTPQAAAPAIISKPSQPINILPPPCPIQRPGGPKADRIAPQVRSTTPKGQR